MSSTSHCTAGPEPPGGYRGHGVAPTAGTEVIDPAVPDPARRPVAPLAQPRRHPNATLLPDGTVLVTGGSAGARWDDPSLAVYAAELWDPATESWSTLASNSVYRGYRSSAVLLPDRRVLSGAPPEERDRALRASALEPERWREYVRPYPSLVVETGGHRVLVDTGS